MTRWMNDIFFHRVVCLVIFFIALIFSLILTVVFVDIDGFLSKSKANSEVTNEKTQENVFETEYINYDDTNEQEVPENEYINIESESDGSYRNKRSLRQDERIKKLTHSITDNKIKEVLITRLTNIIEKLNSEKEIKKSNSQENSLFSTKNNGHLNMEEFKHLVLHNFLLKGIIKHMDINDVYEDMQKLFDNISLPKEIDTGSQSDELDDEKYKKNNEDIIINELINCTQLKLQIPMKKNVTPKYFKHIRNESHNKKNPQLLIKTTIDISGLQNIGNNTNKHNENIKGIFNLLYNGKSIKFNQDKYVPVTTSSTEASKIKYSTNVPIVKRKDFVNQLLDDYYKQYHNEIINNTAQFTSKPNFDNSLKRSKRFVKVAYEPQKHTKLFHNKFPRKYNKHHKERVNDDLYVEIQTHFYKNGSMGEKKKKLVQNLINRIEKAISSNSVTVTNQNKKNKVYSQIKKRTQNPIKSEENTTTITEEDNLLPQDIIKQRYINPLSALRELEKYTNSWRSKHVNPLSDDAIKRNSNGRSLYSKYADIYNNAISQRLQEPISNNNNNDGSNFLITDVDGTGIAVGIQQYVDEPPDSQQIKSYTNVENLFQSYHQNYDEGGTMDDHGLSNDQSVRYKRLAYYESKQKENAPKSDEDYHHSVYKLLLSRKPIKLWPYVNYKDIIHNENENTTESSTNTLNYGNKINITAINRIIMKSQLKPLEILTLSDLINKRRKKRFLNLYKHIKTKIVNKVNKKIDLKSKVNRGKRNTHGDINYRTHSNEDVLMVSNENIYADRAIIKDTHRSELGRDLYSHEQSDYPRSYAHSVYSPEHYLNNFFNTVRTSKNNLMNKYPHMFVEDSMKSKEQTYQDEIINPEDIENYDHSLYPEDFEAPPGTKSNYKVTVRILPKNLTDDASGFKEVQTCINKTYNKNGIAYVSLLNIKEISKIEKLNKTDNALLHNHQNDNHRENTVKKLLQAKKLKIYDEMKKLELEKQKVDRILGYSFTANNSGIETTDQIKSKIDHSSTPDTRSIISRSHDINYTSSNEPIFNQTYNPVHSVIQKHIVEYPKAEELIKKLDKNTEVLEKILKTINLRNELTTQKSPIISNLQNIPYQSNIEQKPIASVTYHSVVYNADNYSLLEPKNQIFNKIPNFQKFHTIPQNVNNVKVVEQPNYDIGIKPTTYEENPANATISNIKTNTFIPKPIYNNNNVNRNLLNRKVPIYNLYSSSTMT